MKDIRKMDKYFRKRLNKVIGRNIHNDFIYASYKDSGLNIAEVIEEYFTWKIQHASELLKSADEKLILKNDLDINETKQPKF
jgi:hypothetical protein